MAIDANELEWLRSNHQQVTGKPFVHFRCPITLDDSIGTGLIDGHIVNQAIKDAARTTVIQRVDVDNHFGSAIEPSLLHFLELGVQRTAESIMNMRPQITAIGSDGRRWPVFIARSAPLPVAEFTAVNLNVTSGPKMGYIRAKPKDVGPNPQIEISRTVDALTHVGALLKVAHLCLFQLLGYSWVLGFPGEYVRTPLCEFFHKRAKVAEAQSFFGSFRGSCATMLDAKPNSPDSLTHKLFLLHSVYGGIEYGTTFGISCLFNMNHKLVVVTVPFCLPNPHKSRIKQWGEVLRYYNLFIADRSIFNTTQVAKRQGDKWIIGQEPLPTIFEGKLSDQIVFMD